MLVIFARNYDRCRRAQNGAWVSGSTETTDFAIDECQVRDYARGSADGTVFTVEWPDGVKETGVKKGMYIEAYSDRLGALLK